MRLPVRKILVLTHNFEMRKTVIIWLPVRRILVLTHNFEMRKPVIARLPVFAICGLWLQKWQWQNCKSKQAVCLDSKPILL